VAAAARLLGRDRTRVYALLRSGDLVAASAADDDDAPAGLLRIERSSLTMAGGRRRRDDLAQHVPTWSLDAYLSVEAFSRVQAQLNQLDLGDDVGDASRERDSVVLRVVDAPWPFPPHYPVAPPPLAALNLLDYPDPIARRSVARRR